MASSRRTFLHHLSAAAGLGLLAQLPARRRWTLVPGELVPDPDEGPLRELALRAVDAARGAGATFADVRVAAGHALEITCEFSRWGEPFPVMHPPALTMAAAYGVRAIVEGAWGFAAGDDWTPDGVARTARTAVARARSNRPRRPRTLELAPAPRVADGRWVAPIAQDPFVVAVGAQADGPLAALNAIAPIADVVSGRITFEWRRALRVFASSEGTLLVQHTTVATPSGQISARAGSQLGRGFADVEGFERGQYGYEAVAGVELTDAVRRAAERAVERAKDWVDPTPVDVGRYDLVLGAGAMGFALWRALVGALDAERVLGYQANAAGTSFAAPPAEILGRYQLGSKHLTLRADRTRPHGAATVRWDDEGVPTEAFPLVQDGVIVDYLTDRQCAAELAEQYRARGEATRSHGCASGVGLERPTVRLPNLSLEPAGEDVTLDDLIRATKRGIYIEDATGQSDQQVLSAQYIANDARMIRNGKLGERLKLVVFQFITPTFWKSLDALGGRATAGTDLFGVGVSPGDPLQLAVASVRAVPGMFRKVNVMSAGRTA